MAEKKGGIDNDERGEFRGEEHAESLFYPSNVRTRKKQEGRSLNARTMKPRRGGPTIVITSTMDRRQPMRRTASVIDPALGQYPEAKEGGKIKKPEEEC